MRTRVMSILLSALLLLPLLIPAASAAALEDLNQPEVFQKQSSSNGTCVLVSTAMMLRRAALLRGDEDWRSIDLNTVRAEFGGMPYKGSCCDFSIDHKWLPGGSENAEILKELLAKHPEGVVLYARCVPHGVLLTDYTDGVFYCCDPAVNKPKDRIPITEAHGTRIDNSCAYWYINSVLPGLTASESDSEPMPEVTADAAVSRLVEAMGYESDDSAALFGQALAHYC